MSDTTNTVRFYSLQNWVLGELPGEPDITVPDPEGSLIALCDDCASAIDTPIEWCGDADDDTLCDGMTGRGCSDV